MQIMAFFQACNKIITWDQRYHDFGVLFDSKLTFLNQINCIISTVMITIGLIHRFTAINNILALRTYFLSCVLLFVDYTSPIWSMASDHNPLRWDKNMNFFIRVISNRCRSLSLWCLFELRVLGPDVIGPDDSGFRRSVALGISSDVILESYVLTWSQNFKVIFRKEIILKQTSHILSLTD